MPARRWIPAAATAGLFGLLLWTACAVPSSPPVPPIPDALELTVTPRAGRIIIYGDTRRGVFMESAVRRTDYGAERVLIPQRLLSENPDLFLHSGDIVGYADSPGLWADWKRDMERIDGALIPVFMAWGNHEYWGDKGLAARNVARHFPHLDGRHWYSLRYGPLLLAVVDTNFGELSPADIARQDGWLQDTLHWSEADSSISTVFLIGHHSPYTNSRVHAPDRNFQDHFVTLFRAHPKVRAVFTGHVHNYEHFLFDGVRFIVAGGGGAPKTAVNTESPAFADQFKGPEVRPFQYCLVTVEKERILVDVMMLDEKDGSWYRGDGFTLP